MGFSLETLLGIHADALKIRSQRSEILANNLANADTPGFKARDIDFKKMLQAAENGNNTAMLQTSNPGHLAASSPSMSMDMLYRVPLQASINGNTVDKHVEVAQFSQNALQYQASLNFLNGKIKSILTALRGE